MVEQENSNEASQVIPRTRLKLSTGNGGTYFLNGNTKGKQGKNIELKRGKRHAEDSENIQDATKIPKSQEIRQHQ